MTITRKISAVTAIAITAAAAAVVPGAAFAATSDAPATATQVREVCAASTYMKQRPGAIPVNTVFRGETLQVVRRSASGAWAYTVHRRPKLTTKGWVKVSDFCDVGEHAEFAKTSRYSVRIANSRAGGDPGYLYVGGPANITVKDNQRAGQKLTLCVTPAPEQRPSCRNGRTGRTIDTIVWSTDLPTEVRISIEGGPTLVETVHPYGMPVHKAAR